MGNREIRISPDGDSVAIRSDHPENAWNAWAVMNAINGGHWDRSERLADWSVVAATQAPE